MPARITWAVDHSPVRTSGLHSETHGLGTLQRCLDLLLRMSGPHPSGRVGTFQHRCLASETVSGASRAGPRVRGSCAGYRSSRRKHLDRVFDLGAHEAAVSPEFEAGKDAAAGVVLDG